MRIIQQSLLVAGISWLLTGMAMSSPAAANINLELRPATLGVGFGCPIKLALYAISDSRRDQTFSAMQVILKWDPSRVQLQGFNNAGGPTYLSTGFGANPYHLNDSTTDGDAMWIALAQLGSANAIHVPPEGRLLTTFNFQTVSGSALPTAVTIELNGGTPVGHTIVYDGTTPNTNITGTLTGASVGISTCVADSDFNHFVDVDDLLNVINHWGVCPGTFVCCIGDADHNAYVDVDDLLQVINAWGPCPP